MFQFAELSSVTEEVAALNDEAAALEIEAKALNAHDPDALLKVMDIRRRADSIAQRHRELTNRLNALL